MTLVAVTDMPAPSWPRATPDEGSCAFGVCQTIGQRPLHDPTEHVANSKTILGENNHAFR